MTAGPSLHIAPDNTGVDVEAAERAAADFLSALGIDARAATLAQSAPTVLADRDRLCDEDQMGTLFKAMAWTAPDWPEPAGFA